MKTQLTLLFASFVTLIHAGLLQAADPPRDPLVWENYQLLGELRESGVDFTLTGTIDAGAWSAVEWPVVSGAISLLSLPENGGAYDIIHRGNMYVLRFNQRGKIDVSMRFRARVNNEEAGWESVVFDSVTAPIRQVELRGFTQETQVEITGATKPVWKDGSYRANLGLAPTFSLRWKKAAPDVSDSKLFFSAEGASVYSVAPGLLRQSHLFNFQVMQGKLETLNLILEGEGEVLRVEGENILTWNVTPAEDGKRRLEVRLNRPRETTYPLLVMTQRSLAAFPLETGVLRVLPEDVIRFGGRLLVVNDGAVRLGVKEARGLSQISPDLFPRVQGLPQMDLRGRQAFAYRFSGPDFTLRLHAANILPELTVNETLRYHLGETDTIIDVDMEVDIREAPLREFSLRIPNGFAMSGANIPNLSDYFLTPATDGNPGQILRFTFSNPVSGRQRMVVRLERNIAPPEGAWELPRVVPENAKTIRGNIGVSADPGFRLVLEVAQGISEMATAYFPQRDESLQLAFRIKESAWSARMTVERLDPSVRVEVLHLYSMGESIVYGSSVLNYFISGAPVTKLQVAVPTGYGNVEFVGADVRDWRKTADGTAYEVHLHSPISGAYTLLATYDRTFPAEGADIALEGAAPVGVDSEQGYVLVVSPFQLRLKEMEVSNGILRLDPKETPGNYRQLVDAPILASYHFTSRPFTINLNLTPFGQGKTQDQVLDYASLSTHVAKTGEVITDIRYIVKSKGQSHFRLRLPEDVRLWSVAVNGTAVTPITDNKAALIPLPKENNPTRGNVVTLKLAGRAGQARRLRIDAPVPGAPALLTQWQITADPGYRLDYLTGTLEPVSAFKNTSGFQRLTDLLLGRADSLTRNLAVTGLICLFLGIVALKRSRTPTSGQIAIGIALYFSGAAAVVLLLGYNLEFVDPDDQILSFASTYRSAGADLSVHVGNTPLMTAGTLWLSILSASAGAVLVIGGLILRRIQPMLPPVAGILAQAAGWTMGLWAMLRLPGGENYFLVLWIAFIVFYLAVEIVRSSVNRQQVRSGGFQPAAALLMFGLLAFFTPQSEARGGPVSIEAQTQTTLVHTVHSNVKITGYPAEIETTVTWRAQKGSALPILSAPAVLTSVNDLPDGVRLEQRKTGDIPTHVLVADAAGDYTATFTFASGTQKADSKSGELTVLHLPDAYGLINTVDLTVDKPGLIIESSYAVSVEEKDAGKQATRALLTLVPNTQPQVWWRPKTRDLKAEKAVFYMEWNHLFVPAAGVVEGRHTVNVRLAQGELQQLVFAVPEPLTITDTQSQVGLASWQFDPDANELRVNFDPAVRGQFSLVLVSQIATDTLPFTQQMKTPSANGAAGQVGLVGVATGPEVQLGTVTTENLSTINLEDFPAGILGQVKTGGENVTLRRAFRYAASIAGLSVEALPVEPEVRVNTNETLSLGEDRVLLSSRLSVAISRAGVFSLSFDLPEGLEVEAVSGGALNHWTESDGPTGRQVTLHLNGKTLGSQEFNITLGGPGIKDSRSWPCPRLRLNESNKHRGQLLIVPEQGLRLSVEQRQGLTQLDPKAAGVKRQGALLFRLLNPDWALVFDIEKVDPWIEVTALQDMTIREGLVDAAVNFIFQIENAGVNALRFELPAGITGVRFSGEHISDTLQSENNPTEWTVRLDRRYLGEYRLQLSYQLINAGQDLPREIRGIRALGVNVQRGFMNLRSQGRLEVNVPQLPATLQRSDRQTVPKALQRGLPDSANYTFRVLTPGFVLPIQAVRHETAEVLPARVERVDLTSVLSEEAMLLTEVRVILNPGSKRYLKFKLPAGARFWFAFYNNQSVMPWRDGAEVLIPLEADANRGRSAVIEFLYTVAQTGLTEGKTGSTLRNAVSELAGPQFDLPLENIEWRIFLPERLQVETLKGTTLTEETDARAATGDFSVLRYMQTESEISQQQTAEVEELLYSGAALRKAGRIQEAQQAFKSAYSLSQHDADYNEDARVQWNTLRMQQAMEGIQGIQDNLRVRVDPGSGDGAQRAPGGGMAPEENEVLSRLAQRLITQQFATTAAPESIRTSLPRQGQVLTFKRMVQVNPWMDMRVRVHTSPDRSVLWNSKMQALLSLFAIVALVVGGMLLRPRPGAPTPSPDADAEAPGDAPTNESADESPDTVAADAPAGELTPKAPAASQPKASEKAPASSAATEADEAEALVKKTTASKKKPARKATSGPRSQKTDDPEENKPA